MAERPAKDERINDVFCCVEVKVKKTGTLCTSLVAFVLDQAYAICQIFGIDENDGKKCASFPRAVGERDGKKRKAFTKVLQNCKLMFANVLLS